MPGEGIKRLAVLCPAFFCDCLETLEEIEEEGREIFMEAGGESYRMIPCLNHSPEGVHCLETIMQNADHWPIQS
jgi:ferrochelatase